MARRKPVDACAVLNRLGIPRGADFHTLRSSVVDGLVDVARAAGYQKPRNANGSRGRYFHAYLQRQAAKGCRTGGLSGLGFIWPFKKKKRKPRVGEKRVHLVRTPSGRLEPAMSGARRRRRRRRR